MLYLVLGWKSQISTKIKLQIIQMYVRSVMTYAGEALGPLLSNSNLEKTGDGLIHRTLYNSSPFYIRNKTILNLPTVQNNIRISTKIMFYKNSSSFYQHIRTIRHSIARSNICKRHRPYNWVII